MRKNIYTFSILKFIIALFCILNIIALFFLLKKDTQSQNNAVSISYEVEDDNVSSEGTDSAVAAPLLFLDESLIPDLSEDDLYDLKDILIKASALKAEDGMENDISDQIEWSITPVTDNPGAFDAEFSITNDNRRSAGASTTVSTTLTSPFLMLTDESVIIPTGTDFSITPYIATAIDIDGSDLSEYVASDGYVNGYSSGTYSTVIYVYSRVNDSMTRKTLTVTVQ